MSSHPETLNDRSFFDFYNKWGRDIILPDKPIPAKLANLLAESFPDNYFIIDRSQIDDPTEIFENVRHIKLDCNTTDDELQDLVRKFPRVSFIDLSDCLRITDAGLSHLQGLTSFTELSLLNCNQITYAGRDELMRVLKNLLIFLESRNFLVSDLD